jgi:hypothetical protein
MSAGTTCSGGGKGVLAEQLDQLVADLEVFTVR